MGRPQSGISVFRAADGAAGGNGFLSTGICLSQPFLFFANWRCSGKIKVVRHRFLLSLAWSTLGNLVRFLLKGFFPWKGVGPLVF